VRTLKRRAKDVKTPTLDAKAFRERVLNSTKKARATCTLCSPPATFSSNSVAERHRTTIHELPRFKHYVLCVGCRSEKTVGYLTHLCMAKDEGEKLRAKCPGCEVELPNPALTIHTYECAGYKTGESQEVNTERKPRGRPKKPASEPKQKEKLQVADPGVPACKNTTKKGGQREKLHPGRGPQEAGWIDSSDR
jgi:hypothetical protein